MEDNGHWHNLSTGCANVRYLVFQLPSKPDFRLLPLCYSFAWPAENRRQQGTEHPFPMPLKLACRLMKMW